MSGGTPRAASAGVVGNDIGNVAVDLPAPGETDGPPCPVWHAAAAVYKTVADLGIDRPIVVGHSMSGAIASISGASFSGPLRRPAPPASRLP